MTGDKDYIDYILASTSMPVLLKQKPSGLINFPRKRIKSAGFFLNYLNKILNYFQIEYFILYQDQKALYFYLYSRELLEQVFHKYAWHPLFIRAGYDYTEDGLEENLKKMKSRYEYYRTAQKDFPHEIGILFGYPLADVEGYIKFSGKNYLLCGYWKVYHEEEQARRQFAWFGEMREQALAACKNGEGLLSLKGKS